MMNSKRNIILLVVTFILLSTVFFVSPFYGHFDRAQESPVMATFPKNSFQETLHVVADIDYAPYSYMGQDARPAGHDVELVNAVANGVEMNLDLRLMSWSEALRAVKEGKADVVLGADVIADEWNADLSMTIPLSNDSMAVFGKEGAKSAGDLYGKKIAVIENNGALTLLKSYMLTPYCTSYATYTEAFKSVAAGENDYVISNYSVGKQIIRNRDMADIKATSVVIMRNYFCFGVNRNRPDLLKKINAELVSLSKGGELDRLQKKWQESSFAVQSLPEYFGEHRRLVGAYVAAVGVSLAIYCVVTIIEAKRREKILLRQAETDSLTGLLNHASAETLMRNQLDADKGNARHALFIVDIDFFKAINDSMGHQQGDRVLRKMADTLRSVFRQEDIVGRLGGDEFFALMKNVQDSRIVAKKSQEISNVLTQCCCEDKQVGRARLSVSIGVALYPEHGKDFPELYARADAALYYVKEHGRNGYACYNEMCTSRS